jgi:hypothetical protein
LQGSTVQFKFDYSNTQNSCKATGVMKTKTLSTVSTTKYFSAGVTNNFENFTITTTGFLFLLIFFIY